MCVSSDSSLSFPMLSEYFANLSTNDYLYNLHSTDVANTQSIQIELREANR